MTDDEFDKLFKQYRERFGEPLPLMMLQGCSNEYMAELIKESLESGEPYDPVIEPGILY